MIDKKLYIPSLVGGATAGLVVDVSLFPLDTIKTRLQAVQGFRNAGGFKGVYKGLGPQVIGSAPTAALFFVTYESFKHLFAPVNPDYLPAWMPVIHMTAASLGETVACLVRVPVEIVKQRRQTLNKPSLVIFLQAYKNEGLRGFYRGFGSTVIREIPFAFIQFPIFEYLRVVWSRMHNRKKLKSSEVALCGAIAGGISAALTTPLDVVKTRIMLAEHGRIDPKNLTVTNMLRNVYVENGFKGLFFGFIPRVMWITLGGAIFFGAYDFARTVTFELME